MERRYKEVIERCGDREGCGGGDREGCGGGDREGVVEEVMGGCGGGGDREGCEGR